MNEDYIPIADTDLTEKIRSLHHENSGTYKLHWCKNGKPKKICRLLDTDCEGVLYIGETGKALYDRVSSLATAIKSNTKENQPKPKERGHKALSKKFFRIRKHIDIKDLYMEVFPVKLSPKEDESKLIEEYVAEFGELPPLNGNYGSHEHWGLF